MKLDWNAWDIFLLTVEKLLRRFHLYVCVFVLICKIYGIEDLFAKTLNIPHTHIIQYLCNINTCACEGIFIYQMDSRMVDL